MDIGELLVDQGLVSPAEVRAVASETRGKRIDQALVDAGLVSEEDALRTLAAELGLQFIELKEVQVDRDLLAQFPAAALFRHSLLPLQDNNGIIQVATNDPFDLEALDELSSITGFQLRPVLARRDDVVSLIKQCLGVGADTVNELVARSSNDNVELLEGLSPEVGQLADEAQAASVIRLVNELLLEALNQRASDVHIEPHENGLTVRFRVDGLLQVQPVPPEIHQFVSAIITRLKIMARLNIAEKRLPQDGRITLKIQSREIDVRVSVIPMLYGEGIVLRLLDKSRMVFSLASAGMPADIEQPFRELITMPHGIVLVTGPTGSGKTTTLYGALNEIKSPTTKIITTEDPVEYHTTGISQIQVQSRIGMTFAAGLRSILRHDPDVILIGEIRDGETAQSAIQASLTGHLVFSTLHTNDAPGAFTRLIDMGVEPYLVSSTVEGVLAQRLVRLLCDHCKERVTLTASQLPPDFPQPEHAILCRPVGCRECRGTGFSGRTGVYELFRTDNTLRRMCVQHADTSQIREYAIQQGMLTLRQCGWRMVQEGRTSIEEVLRITKGDLS